MGTTCKVRYVVGAGCELLVPLSDGQCVFHKDTVYEIPAADLDRLVRNGDFELIEPDPLPEVVAVKQPAPPAFLLPVEAAPDKDEDANGATE